MADAGIEEIARSYARRVVVVIFRARRRYFESGRSVLGRGASDERRGQSWELASAEQAGLDLLVGREPCQVYRCCGIGGKRYCASYQAAIITPVKADPRPALSHLVLEMRSLLKNLIVVDAEHSSWRRATQAAYLRIEETSRSVTEDGKRGEATEVRHTDARRR